MSGRYRDVLHLVFSLCILLTALVIVRRFLVPLLWAAVLCIATWPAYLRLRQAAAGRSIAAALALTLLLAAVLMVPLLVSLVQASRHAPSVAHFIAAANNEGIAAPGWLAQVPLAGAYLADWWGATLGQPHGLAHLLASGPMARLRSAGEVLRFFGAEVFQRLLDAAFAFLSLFFFYKDGERLRRLLMTACVSVLGAPAAYRYTRAIPTAIRATVNGLVLVGLGEGVLIGIAYAFAGLAAPVLWAALTGALAIIPFGAPLAYLGAAGVLFAFGKSGAAAGVALWGTLVLFVADHAVRPVIIGNATRLPFLAVLFGILGGVETFGLVGLFIGPVIMAMFVTLFETARAQRKPVGGTASPAG